MDFSPWLQGLEWTDPQIHFTGLNLNSRRKQQKAYLCFGTDYAHMIDVTESFIIVNENLDQNIHLESEILFYQWTMLA